jgi:molybdopterin-guanine dinucleotide biosynthesis protein A
MNLSAVILAGGASRRMGRDKAWIECGGRPLIVRALDAVRDLGAEEIFVSGRSDADYAALGCPVLFDLEPGLGPLGGIERGLHHATAPLLLVLAVDLPHMNTAFLRALADRCDRLTGVVPQRQGRLEPLAAIYPKRCQRFAFERIMRGSRAARAFAADCLRERAVRRWTPPPAAAACLANCNRPEEVPAGDDRAGRSSPARRPRRARRHP